MKKIKMNLAIVALILGAGAAFASTHKPARQADVLWGLEKDGVTWIQTTLSAHCTTQAQICKEDFPQGQDPNVDDSGGTIVQNNGYVTP